MTRWKHNSNKQHTNCQQILTQSIRTLLMPRWQLAKVEADAELNKFKLVRKSNKKHVKN